METEITGQVSDKFFSAFLIAASFFYHCILYNQIGKRKNNKQNIPSHQSMHVFNEEKKALK